jgi:hypothetical protein
MKDFCYCASTDKTIGDYNAEAGIRYTNREDGEGAGQDAGWSH